MSVAVGIHLSLLDRLCGEDGPRLARIRDGVRRDLEDLLNTPFRVKGWSQDLSALDSSVFNYGVLDLTTANMSTEQRRAEVVEDIGRTIRQFEPRLSDMRIFTVPNADPTDRVVRIRIEAQMFIESEMEPIIFNTVIDPLFNSISMTSGSS